MMNNRSILLSGNLNPEENQLLKSEMISIKNAPRWEELVLIIRVFERVIKDFLTGTIPLRANDFIDLWNMAYAKSGEIYITADRKKWEPIVNNVGRDHDVDMNRYVQFVIPA